MAFGKGTQEPFTGRAYQGTLQQCRERLSQGGAMLLGQLLDPLQLRRRLLRPAHRSATGSRQRRVATISVRPFRPYRQS
ncbi:hypothetical protein GCM10010411_42640 [Actinomadura fulvescens]|uniref:Uncharacterized protein n=1 Tax=Actinomadura fulvescens TaxID=46160 RepID=A0ABN3PV84_9ACTN